MKNNINKKTMTEIFTETLKESPDCFSAREFTDKAIEKGYQSNSRNAERKTRFLKIHCFNEGYRSKIWHKKKSQNQTNMSFETERDNLSEDICIKFLKDLGYKILRPVKEFEEV